MQTHGLKLKLISLFGIVCPISMTKEKIMKKCKGKKDEVKAVYHGDCNNCDEIKKCKTYQNMHYDEDDENPDLSEIELLKDWD